MIVDSKTNVSHTTNVVYAGIVFDSAIVFFKKNFWYFQSTKKIFEVFLLKVKPGEPIELGCGLPILARQHICKNKYIGQLKEAWSSQIYYAYMLETSASNSCSFLFLPKQTNKHSINRKRLGQYKEQSKSNQPFWISVDRQSNSGALQKKYPVD